MGWSLLYQLYLSWKCPTDLSTGKYYIRVFLTEIHSIDNSTLCPVDKKPNQDILNAINCRALWWVLGGKAWKQNDKSKNKQNITFILKKVYERQEGHRRCPHNFRDVGGMSMTALTAGDGPVLTGWRAHLEYCRCGSKCRSEWSSQGWCVKTEMVSLIFLGTYGNKSS